ncbi:MAG: hypothetical protein GF344_04285 [Chitinivibrionales bacterium]|nr:hypothetical protein [Chitinivibrionales bacterium]MBD3356263.1 hypothetical protein [Chitinivibrionales bacterium]
MHALNRAICGIVAVAVAGLITTSRASDEIDVILSAHSVPASARSGGLLNAGAAMLDGVAGILANPAVPTRYFITNENTLGFTYSYGRGAVFSDHIITAGSLYSLNPQLTVGGMYRLLRQDENRYQNELIINASGRMFQRTVERGPVDLGINARLEDMKWELRDLTKPTRVRYTATKDNTWEADDTTYGTIPSNTMWEERRILFDLGLYQRQFTETLDFGITFHNLFGYQWRKHKPLYECVSRRNVDSSGVKPNDTTRIDSCYYLEDDGGRQIDPYYKRMSIGMLYHVRVVDGKALVQVPLQAEFIGIFDRSEDTHFIFRTGLEVWFRDSYCLRFGYARAPRQFPSDAGIKSYENDNIVGGGGGILLERFGIDLYVYGDEWGLATTVSF